MKFVCCLSKTYKKYGILKVQWNLLFHTEFKISIHLLIVIHNPNYFERTQLFDLIVHLIIISQELLDNFFVCPKSDFKKLFGRLIGDRRFEPTP